MFVYSSVHGPNVAVAPQEYDGLGILRGSATRIRVRQNFVLVHAVGLSAKRRRLHDGWSLEYAVMICR